MMRTSPREHITQAIVSTLRAALGLRILLMMFSIMISGTAGANTPDTDLTALSLEDLMKVKISIVAKHAESLNNAPAAVFVITSDDIRRSGATSIPEVLRLAPGLHVARIDGNRWAISTRGFSGQFSNKLLVLIDGRSVYTTIFSGVFWDVQDTLLEDIDRIEVIRGPGAAVWGANAVNGVINIITRHSKETTGGVASGGIGTEERGFGNARYGVSLGENTFMRVYGKYFNRDNTKDPAGRRSLDDWDSGQAGFRIDSLQGSDALTLQGDVYAGHEGFRAAVPEFTPPYQTIQDSKTTMNGGNVLGRWTHTASPGAESTVQFYYDRTHRNISLVDATDDTFDIDVQQHLQYSDHHEIMVGIGYRTISDDLDSSDKISFNPHEQRNDLFSAFAQDEISLAGKELRLTLGSKFEHNDFTGFEFQPSAKLIWQPTARQSIWSSVSRAVRTPSRASEAVALQIGSGPTPLGIPFSAELYGSRDAKTEVLLSYELGYRLEVTKALTFDVATFFNDYSKLVTVEPFGDPSVKPLPIPHLENPFVLANMGSAHAIGGEFVAGWQPLKSWRLQGWYSYINVATGLDGGSADTSLLASESNVSQNQVALRSLIDLPYNLEFDTTFRYLDRVGAYSIDPYCELGVRLGWRPSPRIEVSLSGENLLHNQHQEAVADFVHVAPAEIQRAVYGKLTIHF